MVSKCICSLQEQPFKTVIDYKSDIFPKYKGAQIGRCAKCGVLKTVKHNDQFNPQISEVKFYENQRELLNDSFQPIIDQVKAYSDIAQVLDVGCSSGILLEILDGMGYDVTGIEPNPEASGIAKGKLGNKIKRGYLEDNYHKFPKKFDVIIYNHVLEHVEDINKEFDIIKQILKPGGILIIGVPNSDNVIFKIRGLYWEALKPDQHIWHFSYRYLRKYLKKSGFIVKNIQFFDDPRMDYPLVKRIYFNLLSKVNNMKGTGEAMLITTVMK